MLLCACVVFFRAFAVATRPTILSTTLVAADGTERALPLPFSIRTSKESRSFTLRVVLHADAMTARIYRVIPDDCIDGLVINGTPYPGKTFPFCDLRGDIVDLERYLREGANTLEFDLRDKGGDAKFDLRPFVLRDPLYAAPKALIVFAAGTTLAAGANLAHALRKKA